jgi:hypothetical protein
VNAVCITRTLAYACWLLRDFSDTCEGFLKSAVAVHIIFITQLSVAREKRNCRGIAELTVMKTFAIVVRLSSFFFKHVV